MGKKYYVVWEGRDTGVFDNWDEVSELVDGYPGAKYRGFPSRESALRAFRGEGDAETVDMLKAIAEARPEPVLNLDAFPEIDRSGIAVDAACSRNPGPVEYRGVDLATGSEIFHVGPLQGGTNNLGEFLAIVHALAMLQQQGRRGVAVYSDSRTAMAWVRNRQVRTSITPTPQNERLLKLVSRALSWLQTNTPANHVTKWNTSEWGEIPADFGRK